MNDQSYELLFILSGMTWIGLFLAVYALYRLYVYLSKKLKR